LRRKHPLLYLLCKPGLKTPGSGKTGLTVSLQLLCRHQVPLLSPLGPPSEPVSVKNLKALDRISPPPVNVSLDRYLASSRTDEPVATQILQSNPATQLAPLPINIPTLNRSDSDVNSVGSAQSIASGGSFRSTDSRGSRQGRRGWTKPTSSNNAQAIFEYPQLSKTTKSKRYFCTWPDCDCTFAHRFEWARHEEAVHYCPYHWVCCSEQNSEFILRDCWFCDATNVTLRHVAKEHLSTCTRKCTQQRTFLREDLFVAHLRRHLDKASYKNVGSKCRVLARRWKEDNLAMDPRALHCGICGKTFMTWAERSFHVRKHMEGGVTKAAWWPDRLPIPLDFPLG
jgi:hypothetical protein